MNKYGKSDWLKEQWCVVESLCWFSGKHKLKEVDGWFIGGMSRVFYGFMAGDGLMIDHESKVWRSSTGNENDQSWIRGLKTTTNK